MSRKSRILALALAGVGCFWVSSASAAVLTGNVWPNPTLETAAAPGIDQVYSYYNSNDGGVTPSLANGGVYQPYLTGDTNSRPLGWHRGNGDFGTIAPTGPTYTFWNSTPPVTTQSPPSGAALSGTHSLLVTDSDTNNSGEWFSDFNALPAGSQGTGTPFEFQFSWQYTNITSTQRPAASDVFRVSVRWADFASDDVMSDPPNTSGPDELIFDGSPNVTTWTQIDQLLTPPVGANAMRVTIDSGGSSAAEGNLWVDDISIAAVPEPTSLAMLSGGLLLLARRRRQA
jgi:hypothetical protein